MGDHNKASVLEVKKPESSTSTRADRVHGEIFTQNTFVNPNFFYQSTANASVLIGTSPQTLCLLVMSLVTVNNGFFSFS